EEAVRLLVGSANATEYGYRHNIEAMSVLTVTKKNPQHRALVLEAISGGKSVLRPWLDRTNDVVVRRAEAWLSALPIQKGEQTEWFCWGGDSVPVWKQVLEHWPKGDTIRVVTIVS